MDLSRKERIALWREFQKQQRLDAYRYKRSLGLCIERNCTQLAVPMARCNEHLEKATEAVSRFKRDKRKATKQA